MVAIEVADDGRGVAAELLRRAGDGSLADVLAEAGFSTADGGHRRLRAAGSGWTR